MNCDRWHGNSLEWFTYWMQNIPGANNGLTYQGKPLVNWWVFLGDFDNAMKRKMTLVGPSRLFRQVPAGKPRSSACGFASDADTP